MDDKQTICLVGLDLDGTLLNEKFLLTPTVVQAFRQASQANLQVVVITGRDRLSALPFLQQLGAEKTVITSGGARVWLNGDLISQVNFTPQQTRDIIGVGLQYKAGMFVDQPHQTLRYGASYYTNLYRHVCDSVEINGYDELLSPPPLKVSLIQEPPVLKTIRAHLTEIYPSFTLSSPFSQVLDVNPDGINKGMALTRLADSLGISLSQTAVAGDSENDLSMFTIAGISYAMGNAADSLRACADFIAPTNEEDGAAWVLGEIMQRNQESQ